ncbi:MAG: rhomboid family intramembrane serine protease [Flavobacteriales bacterium]|nr:rhomboid family intramembrane serine protease [Flavobacteriales bacterium]MCB9168028.1 rhomboid family intramembrane serine protease [Flavobacteriales bacterium]
MSATLGIILITAVVSVWAFNDARIFTLLLFEPFVIRARKEYFRFVTHAFVHANWPHLFVNMFVLYAFGRSVEVLFGSISGLPPTAVYLTLYFSAMIVASVPGYLRHMRDPNYRSVGASGAVSAILFAHILMMPTRPIYLFLLPVPIPSVLFGALYLGYEWYMDRRGGDGVAHDAHFFGAVYGVLFTALLQPDLLLHFGRFENLLGI